MTARTGLLRVAVVGGGESAEHEVSLASAASVVAVLDAARYEPVALTVDRAGVWHGPAGALGADRAGSLAAALPILAGCDVAIPMVHGPLGEDGTLAALCALAGVPAVGSPTRAGAVGMDKWATKAVAESVGIPTAPARLLTGPGDLDAALETARYPVVVKPSAAGSSHGVGVARDADELRAAVAAAAAFDTAVLVEEFVVGREIDVAVLRRADGGLAVSPPLEVGVDPGGVFDTATKYDGTARFVLPAVLSTAERAALEQAALRLFVTLGCSGVARVDFFLTGHGPVLNEINTTPGFSAASQVPRMFAAAGLPYAALVDELIEGALAARG